MTNRITITLPEGSLAPELRAALGDLVLRLARATGGIGLEFSSSEIAEALVPVVLPRESRDRQASPAPVRSNGHKPRRTAAPRRTPARQTRATAASGHPLKGRKRTPESIAAFKRTMAEKRAQREKTDAPQGQPPQASDGPNAPADPSEGQTPVGSTPIYNATFNNVRTLTQLRRASYEVAPVTREGA